MEEEKKPEFENVQPNEPTKLKKPINKFVIKYIIFVIILILITAIGIYFTIRYIDQTTNENQIIEEKNDENDDEIEEKKNAEDSIYGIKSYSETYDTNSLEIKHYYDLDGKITREDPYTGYETRIEFIQIDGLKNKDIQDRINAKLKNTPYSLEKEKFVFSYLSANFSNVLSVIFSSDKEYEIKTLNFDLTTGEEITFEKLFVSSAPIKSMIATGMYEDFAWEKYSEGNEYAESFDMDDVDASEIEEEILLAVKKIDSLKDKIVYSFSPTMIHIYNPEVRTSFNIADYAKEIAIYKRYLTEESIFEDNDLGTKGVIVFTENIDHFGDDAQQISYGKISDNIFVEEILWKWDESLLEEDMNTVRNYINNLSRENKAILKRNTSSDKGVIFQGEYSVYKEVQKGYYYISVTYYKAQCELPYFKNEAFRNYIEVKSKERADVGLNAFGPYMQKDYPEMQISEPKHKTYYLSVTGEFLGNTEEELINKTWE